MSLPSPKFLLLILSLFLIPIFGYLFWHTSTSPDTLSDIASFSPTLGTKVIEDLSALPTLPIKEEKDHFKIEDSTSDGIQIQYANKAEAQTPAPKQTVTFPKDPKKPIEVRLDQERVIPIQDQSTEGYTLNALTREKKDIPFYQALFQQDNSPREYLRYEGDRKTLLYAYEKDQATGEKKLKHWTLYASGTGLEEEKYQLDNVKLKINENGDAEVFYFGEQQIQNEAVKAEVAPSLLERAQKTLEKDLGNDILNNQTPDFIIPRPYYLDREGESHDLDWKWDEEKKTLSVSFSPESYPVALDPTLSFTAPGQSNTGSVITGEGGLAGSIESMTSGDFNADGRMDLAMATGTYSTNTGRVYIFYNDGFYPSNVSAADVIITGESTTNYFGFSMDNGDLNRDGKTDLVVSAYTYATNTGRVYVFYNDGVYPSAAASADVILTGGAVQNNFGASIETGDFNFDGVVDLAVGAFRYSSYTGRTYIFYGGSMVSEDVSGADVTITGDAVNDYFGNTLSSGDFNADGRIDLVVSTEEYSSTTGRLYIFYNDGSIPTTAGTADVIITGEGTSQRFGGAVTKADINADGKDDLIVGALTHSSSTGKIYVFYNGSIITENASGADLTITGESGSRLGYSLSSGDFNADGRKDIMSGGWSYSTNTGRVYIFYNDGTLPTTAATADVIITGQGTNNYFGYALAVEDFNADGRTDFSVGAYNYASLGQVYIFYSQNGQVNTNLSITGNATGDQFGYALAAGDLNSDGRTDLIVGANTYSTSTGRAYIFYGDGQIPTAAGSADITITGNATSDEFGKALVTGDFDADGDTDLAVGAPGYSTNTGRVYLFYNDSSIPTTAGTADVTITGEATSNYFGYALAAGPLKTTDKKTDLIASAYGYSSNAGRVYLLYNDGSIPTTAATADVIISGSANNNFGQNLVVDDFDADGDTDLVATVISASGGHTFAHFFYNDGSIPTTAATADVIFDSGAASVAFAMAAGDFNSDGRIDLVLATRNIGGSSWGFVLYNDGSWPTSSADLNISGESDTFGSDAVAGDFNADGRTDFAISAATNVTNTGKTYVFYNDGSIPTTAATADVIITGETTNNYFGYAMTAGDMNGDGRTDLVVGAYGNTSSTGKVYFYETRENFAWEIQRQAGTTPRTNLNGAGQELKTTGEATSNNFGTAMTTGDLNADGKTDLVVGATGYSSNRGRVYIFYNRGSLVSTAASADVAISPTSASGLFGETLTVGDFNADGRVDLAVGNSAASSNTGQIYIFYNDGSYPSSPSNADVTITGESSSYFGGRMASGDFNTDGKTDLAVGAVGYSTNTGRAYIFYNDGSIPTTAATADVTITGETTLNYFGGYSLVAGDFNADGRIDLATGAIGYSSNTGRVYIFYNDGSIPTTAATADVTITGGATGDNFGSSLASADLNADGKTDLVVGAYGYSTNTGRVYIFYNDGSIPTTAGTADVTITDQSATYQFGYFGSLDTGDFNTDGRIDLAAGAYCYSSCTGRAYIFYNDGSYPASTASADVTLTGEASSSYFGIRLTSGDINADGRADLVVSAYNYSSGRGRVYTYTFGNDPVITGEATNNYFSSGDMLTGDFNSDGKNDLLVSAGGYSTNTGRVYLFYGGKPVPSAASSADVIITGNATGDLFGATPSLAVGDFNSDGRLDFAICARGYSTNTGRVYIFYNDGSIPTTAGTADVTITGEATNNYFGSSLTSGDLNADGKTDLVVGAHGYSSNTGRVYIFYNDGSIPTTAATADVTITGESNSYFGIGLTAGDLTADGRTDLVVGASNYSSITGRAYIFYNDGSIPTTAGTADVTITGETTNNYFGYRATVGDFNADGRTDLAVGAYGYSTNTGRVYIFYNDGSIPTTAATADVTITGETTNNYFGISLTSGDLNADGKTDLVVGAYGYSTNTGRVYIFYNDGSIPTTAATADVTVTGSGTSQDFGSKLFIGDFHSDGIVDLFVGAQQYSTYTGRLYIFGSEAATTSVLPATSSLKGTGKLKGTAKLR